MKELIEKLKQYNRWRRGDDTVPYPHPNEVGKMIDQAVEALENDKIHKNYLVGVIEKLVKICDRYEKERQGLYEDELVTLSDAKFAIERWKKEKN